jgi:basic membrane protein A and related proteins
LAFYLSMFLTLSLSQPLVVGLHFDQGDWTTPGFNKDVWDGVNAATRDLTDSVFDVLILPSLLDTSGQLHSLPQDLDLIIAAGSTQVPFAQAAAKTSSKSHILLIDAVLDAPNVNSVLFKEYEVSYLLGYLAGSLSQTAMVGFIGETRNAKTLANVSTYTQGVKTACSDCVVISSYTEEPNHPEKAYSLAENQKLRGVDIFFSPAGGSSIGVINYVNSTMCTIPINQRSSLLTTQLSSIATSLVYTASCQNAIPLFFIGDDNNQPILGDNDNDPKTLTHGLSAIRKRADRLAYQALSDSVQGRMSFGTRVVGLSDGAIEYAVNTYNENLIPQELINKLEELKTQIISGEIILTLPAPQ